MVVATVQFQCQSVTDEKVHISHPRYVMLHLDLHPSRPQPKTGSGLGA